MPSWDSRMFVPRPASNCSLTALQLLSSSPYCTSVPGPANPLKVGGPPPEPVTVTTRHGAACTVGTAAHNNALPTRTESTSFIDDLTCKPATLQLDIIFGCQSSPIH